MDSLIRLFAKKKTLVVVVALF